MKTIDPNRVHNDLGLKSADFIERPGARRFHFVDKDGALVKRVPVTSERKYRRVRGEHKSGYCQFATPAPPELGEMIQPAVRKHVEQAHEDMAARDDVRLVSEKGNEYAPPETAEAIAKRNGWRIPPAWGKWTERTIYHADGTVSVYRR